MSKAEVGGEAAAAMEEDLEEDGSLIVVVAAASFLETPTSAFPVARGEGAAAEATLIF